jgi:hypothetical protein
VSYLLTVMNDLDSPFSCAGLKLAVLDHLLSLGEIQLGTPEEFASRTLGRPVDLEKGPEGYALIPECLEALRRYPLTPAQLAKVNKIYLSPTLDIVNYVHRFWDGEDELMDVENLQGLENCPSVESFIDEDMLKARDLAPLSSLTKLSRIKFWNYCENLKAIRGLESLKKLEIKGWKLSSEEQAVINELRGRGVTVIL